MLIRSRKCYNNMFHLDSTERENYRNNINLFSFNKYIIIFYVDILFLFLLPSLENKRKNEIEKTFYNLFLINNIIFFLYFALI